jgi:3-deoxy-D-manno-octulosonate 8-phosphate phosphatase (KDO 8-P phosphatase)
MQPHLSDDIVDSLREVRALFLDCDGVLTTGDIPYDGTGPTTQSFFARDGMGIALLARAGISIGIVSGRQVEFAKARHEQLGVNIFVGSCHNKRQKVIELCDKLDITLEQAAFVGDDLPDLGPLGIVGCPIAVADAVPELKARALWVTTNPGGAGAVREVCEGILKAQGHWTQILKSIDSN